ncbi:hypothetical protein JCM3775_002890 [Rhodotorula graminis]
MSTSTATATTTRSLYRLLWRSLGRLAYLDRPRLANLRRLLRPQLRQALAEPGATHSDLQAQTTRTLTLLRSSPRLTSNLASLFYHHSPLAIPHTRNTARLAHLARPVSWDPRDPGAARRAFERREAERERDAAVRVARGVDGGLRRAWEEAGRAAGGVWLGRVERDRYR